MNLDKLLAYKNEKILDRYRKDHPNNKCGAEEALTELLKFFWLGEKLKKDKMFSPDDKNLKFVCSIHSEMKEIDDMWHTFLLFTRDYADFSKKYFGSYIHHTPHS